MSVIFGAHISISKGLVKAVDRANDLGKYFPNHLKAFEEFQRKIWMRLIKQESDLNIMVYK